MMATERYTSTASIGLRMATCRRPANLNIVVLHQSADQLPPPPPPPAQSKSRQHRRRSNDSARNLMSCVSGQRSPTSPGDEPSWNDRRPPLNPSTSNSRSSRRSSRRTTTTNNNAAQLSVFDAESATSITKTNSVDSGVDVVVTGNISGGSSEREDEMPMTEGRSPTSVESRSIFSCSSSASSFRGRSHNRSSHLLAPPPVAAAGRSISDSSSPVFDKASPNPDRKQSVSPALWRSISSSSLVRSLSRRRAASKNRDGGTRSKQSSVDTDSDCENRDMDASRRRRKMADSPVTADGANDRHFEFPNVRRQSEVIPPPTPSSKSNRRRGFFGRSFRRSRSTPAEEFVALTRLGSDAGSRPEATFDSLPRTRGKGRDVGGFTALTPSSRGTSLSSLSRSQTSESLSGGRGQHGSVDGGVYLVATLKFDPFMLGKVISGMAITDKQELVIVDFRSAYVIDPSSCRLVRVIGGKGSGRLVEPIGVAASTDGRLAFSDHADQSVKVFSGRGHLVRSVSSLGLTNIGGIAVGCRHGDVFVAGTDSRRVILCRATGDRGTEAGDGPLPAVFQHPYCVAVNPSTGDIIVGDDHAQTVTCLYPDGQKSRWTWTPPPSNPDGRPFFPSSVCVDTSGHVFIADLYNEKIYVVDSLTGNSCSPQQPDVPLLSRGSGLRGGPAALCVDGHHRLYVADEDRTVHVFSYFLSPTGGVARETLAPIEQRLNCVDAGSY